jgi:FixJ family two-component response regulator
MASRPLVSVVDDDESVRESLPDLLWQLGFTARTFASAEEFLAAEAVSETNCLLLDITMPGVSGPELQQELTRRGQNVPIIFIPGHEDRTIRERLRGRGAVECLFKPFSEAELLTALDAALSKPGLE